MLLQHLKLILVLFVLQTEATEKCITPDNKEGECISLYSCSSLLDVLSSKQNSSIEFVRRSSCESCGLDHLVCCISPSSNNNKTVSDSVSKVASQELIPSRRYCGFQHSDDYFHTENSTGIDEFPWLAILIYARVDNPNITGTKCTGSLISNRYVLTAPGCMEYDDSKLIMVRLGEHNVKTQADCIESSQFGKECLEPPRNFDIEKVIVHPEYRRKGWKNNIALLRLNTTVTYSDFIRPICLPTPGTKFAQPGDILSASGWGNGVEVEWALFSSSHEVYGIKIKVLSKLLSYDYCRRRYAAYRMPISEEHFCSEAFSDTKDFICQGGQGAPVMFSYKNQWHLEGVVLIQSCGQVLIGLSTKVAYYLDWIVDNIKP